MMRHLALALILVLVVGLVPHAVQANGGQVRIAGERVGPYELTAFTSPSPLRVGTVDVSAMLQRPGTSDAVLDARVWVTADRLGQSGEERTWEATHEQATNKLFYAAEFDLPTEGQWRFTVRVETPEGQEEASFEADVSGPGLFGSLSWLPWLIVALLVIGALWWIFSGGDDEEEGEDAAPLATMDKAKQ